MTYASLGLVFVALAAVPVLVAVVRRRPRQGRRTWWVTTAVLVVVLVTLTLVFDNVMIAADLYRYAEGGSLAVLGRAPVEDLAWPLAAALLLPALWLLVPGTRRGAEQEQR